jgi:ABC-type amino acid transport substrate-binding protein
MKKLLVLLFALLLLAGCTNSTTNTNSEPEKTINIAEVKSIADLKGAKVAVQTDLHEDLAKQIEDVQYNFYDNLDMSATAVKSGIMDVAIMDEPIAITYCAKDPEFAYVQFRNNENGFTVAEADYANAAAFKKGNPLRDEVEAVIAAVDMETYYQLMEEVLKVSAGETIDGFCLHADAPATTKGTLKVGMECASEPFNWTDIDAPSFGHEIIAGGSGIGQPCNGLDVQVARYVANKLGYDLEIYALEWESLLPAVDAGTIDCIIGNMSPREDRKVDHDFTSSYYNVNYVVLYKK